ncbi:MAG: B12-binding domain-containing radical SAM protein [Fibrobacterota bacterium]
MKNKNIVFIEPLGDSANVFDNYMKLPLMGPFYLGTILHNNGYDVRILNENVLGRRIDPFEIDADIFCITSLTVSANRAKLLARQLRQLYPSSKILIGGIHASLLSDEFLEVADHVISGEAEEIILDLVEGKITDKLVYGNHIKNLDSLPLINYGLLENIENMDYIPIMTSRGCPFDCNFCTVTKIFGKKFRTQSPDRIIGEIKNALKHFKTRNVFFYDDNLTANRRRAEELYDKLLEEDVPVTWSAQVRADLAKKPELLKKMRDAGCSRVFIGFESIEEETLKAYKKSQTISDIENAIRRFHEYGINIHGMFMFGEDNDTLDTINRTLEFAVKHEIDTLQFMILTPFPGTQVYDMLVEQKRLYHKNWDYYNGMYIVFRPKNMNPLKLQRAVIKAYKKFYSFRRTMSDSLRIGLNIFLDALVFNFSRVFQYDFNTILVRFGAKMIVGKYGEINHHYLEFLDHVEKKQISEK